MGINIGHGKGRLRTNLSSHVSLFLSLLFLLLSLPFSLSSLSPTSTTQVHRCSTEGVGTPYLRAAHTPGLGFREAEGGDPTGARAAVTLAAALSQQDTSTEQCQHA